MKHSLHLLSLVLSLATVPALAQTNIRVNPLTSLVGVHMLDVDFKLTDNATLGPTLSYINFSDDGYDVTGYSAGIRANIYLNGEVFTQGWYVAPRLQYLSLKVEDTIGLNAAEGSAGALDGGALIGYQWMWENFNINLGAGVTYIASERIKVKDDFGNEETYSGYSGVAVPIEFTVGWKF